MAEDYKTGKIDSLYSDGHAVKIGDNWYDIDEKIKKYVTKDYKGADVKYKDKQDGKRKVIFLLYKQDGNKKPVETNKSASTDKPTGSTCEDCGEPIDGQYKKCWKCNNKNPVKKTGTEEKRPNEYWDKKDLEIKRGNALNAASNAINALQAEILDIDTLKTMVIALAEGFLEDYLLKEVK